MGRPINEKFIGNITGTGQQIVATAYIPGTAGPTTAWIKKQVATNTYLMADASGPDSGRCQLVQGGADLEPGQANITVTPYGASGANATGTARMGAVSATVVTSGSGAITADYDIGDTVTVSGGTSTAAAIFDITGIRVGQMALNAAGYNYNAGNQITIGGAGWVSNVVVAVQTVDAAGAITGFVQVAGGGIRNAAKIDTVSGTTLEGSSGNADVSGTDATFNVRWGVANVAVAGAGVYSVLPSNPASTTTDGSGEGATLTVGYNVTNVVVTNGGVDFDAAAVTFTPAGAQALATVNAAGSISAVSVTSGGPTVTAVPTVTLGPVNTVQYAAEIRNRTVTTFDDNTFSWIFADEDLVSSNQARIQTS